MTYQSFLESKVAVARETGFDIDPKEINPALMPHQRDTVVWALKGGRRAVFCKFVRSKRRNIFAVYHYAAGGRTVKPAEKIKKRTFTRAARS